MSRHLLKNKFISYGIIEENLSECGCASARKGLFRHRNPLSESDQEQTLWRTAHILGADFMFIIGKRYENMRTDTRKSWRHVPLFEYPDYETFRSSLPKGSKLVGIELDEQSVPLATYSHPERAVYLLGAEDFGLPPEVIATCDDIVQIPGKASLNVSVAGSIVIYDRLLKRGGFGSASMGNNH